MPSNSNLSVTSGPEAFKLYLEALETQIDPEFSGYLDDSCLSQIADISKEIKD